MANKATPKRRKAKQAAADKGKVDRGVKASRARRAKTGTANGEREDAAPSNVTRATIEEYYGRYAVQRKDEEKAGEALKTEKSKTSGILKEAKENGCPIDAFKEVYSMGKFDQSEIRLRQRDVKRVLSIVRPTLAKQLDMFVDVKEVVVDYDAQGYAAYKNNEPKSNDPAKPGSEESALWNGGWDRSMNENIKSMGPGATTAATTDTVQ